MPAKELQAQLRSVADLFSEANVHYEIPIYQRNYAWGQEQIEQLIDDVWNAAEADDDTYFLGNLILARRPPGSDLRRTIYEVIDGQQRLTTLYLLLTNLDIAMNARLTYQSRRTATEALAVLQRSEDEEGSGIHTGFKIIKARMDRLSSVEHGTSRFAAYLRERVMLVRAVLPQRIDLNRYFEIMNTRGQQLQQVDIVKARLMGYLQGNEASGADEARAAFAWIWEACAEVDSYIQMALTPGDTRLREQIFGGSWDRLQHRRFDELQSLVPSTSQAQAGVADSGSVGLQAALGRYARAAERPVTEDAENRRFESPVKFPSLLLHALKVLRGSTADDLDDTSGRLDDSRLIQLFDDEFRNLLTGERSERVKRFAEELLRAKFVLDNFVIKREYTQTHSEDGAWSLKRITRGEVVSREGGKTRISARFPSSFTQSGDESDDAPTDDLSREVLLLQSMLRVTYTSPRTMHWITAVLRLPLERTRAAGAADVRSVLQTYARRKAHDAFFLRERPTGFAIERIVFTYLDYLLAKDRDPGFTFMYRNSIEHFFPQFADREQKSWDRLGPEDPELQLFGNLALVSVGANSKFSNNLPENKVRFRETIQQSMKLRLMADEVERGALWDGGAIRAHHRKMVDLLRADLGDPGLTFDHDPLAAMPTKEVSNGT